VILAVEATLPRDEPEPADTPEQAAPEEKSPERISREELYEDIKDAAECSRVYIAMVVLSTIVAAVGLYYDSVAIIIGAMVIAPLLGPNMALSLGTTLGDLPLLHRAIMTALAGIATTMALSVIIGVLVQMNPASPELASRNGVGLGDIAVALASGCAGALAFTTGVSPTLIGVMVAVALLPPLVAFGLLLGGGHPALAMGAMSLFLVNLISVNVSGARHSSGNLVGERSSRKSHAHRTQAMDSGVCGIGRLNTAVSKELNIIITTGEHHANPN
jgi:uncharacterized hydrophobic protein (TIGR00341 family)